MTQIPVLSVKDYSVSYSTPKGPFTVLENIDLTIGKGEIVGLVGESGSGKSTLSLAIMRALRGRIAHESGDVLLRERSVMALGAAALADIRGKRIAMVFQDPGGSLNPTLTLGEHFVQVLNRHRGLGRKETIQEIWRLLDMVELPDTKLMAQKYPHEVSGGEKQRAVIALAFACDPELILFDEPTSALDATTAVNILDLFRELQARTSVSALFISHDLSVVRELAHRAYVIYAGRIVEMADIDGLFGQPRHPYTSALLASLPKHAADGTVLPLTSIAGSLPDRLVPIIGCNFADRCDYVTAQCRSGRIRLDDDPDHAVACPFWQTAGRGPDPSAGGEDVSGKDRDPSAIRLGISQLSVSISRPDLFARLMGRQPKTVHAVNNVDLALHAGETVGLVGESGCGKSSLARALAGLREFTGTIATERRTLSSIRDIDASYRKAVQIIFQNPDLSLNPRHTIATILSRPLKLYPSRAPGSDEEKILALLARVNLPPEYASRYPHELSGGEKQRIAIARALAAEPEVIICDEITSGLDASVQAAIINLLREIQLDSNVSYLFITHDLNLLRHIADRVAVMYLGEIVETRTAKGLGAPPYHPYTEALLSSAPVLDPAINLRRVRLHGNLPSRTGHLAGCPFESRCPRRVGDICRTERPIQVGISTEHRICCHIETIDLCAIPAIWTVASR